MTNIESSKQQKQRLNQMRITRKQMLEPLKALKKVRTIADEVRKSFEEEQASEVETLHDRKEKMGDQFLQIDIVRKFVDK